MFFNPGTGVGLCSVDLFAHTSLKRVNETNTSFVVKSRRNGERSRKHKTQNGPRHKGAVPALRSPPQQVIRLSATQHDTTMTDVLSFPVRLGGKRPAGEELIGICNAKRFKLMEEEFDEIHRTHFEVGTGQFEDDSYDEASVDEEVESIDADEDGEPAADEALDFEEDLAVVSIKDLHPLHTGHTSYGHYIFIRDTLMTSKPIAPVCDLLKSLDKVTMQLVRDEVRRTSLFLQCANEVTHQEANAVSTFYRSVHQLREFIPMSVKEMSQIWKVMLNGVIMTSRVFYGLVKKDAMASEVLYEQGKQPQSDCIDDLFETLAKQYRSADSPASYNIARASYKDTEDGSIKFVLHDALVHRLKHLASTLNNADYFASYEFTLLLSECDNFVVKRNLATGEETDLIQLIVDHQHTTVGRSVVAMAYALCTDMELADEEAEALKSRIFTKTERLQLNLLLDKLGYAERLEATAKEIGIPATYDPLYFRTKPVVPKPQITATPQTFACRKHRHLLE